MNFLSSKTLHAAAHKFVQINKAIVICIDQHEQGKDVVGRNTQGFHESA